MTHLIVAAVVLASWLQLANIIVGLALPHAIAILIHVSWSKTVKSSVAFAVCLVAALVTSAAADELTPADWGLSAMTVFTAAQASYHLLWRPSGITSTIETKTSPGSG